MNIDGPKNTQKNYADKKNTSLWYGTVAQSENTLPRLLAGNIGFGHGQDAWMTDLTIHKRGPLTETDSDPYKNSAEAKRIFENESED